MTLTDPLTDPLFWVVFAFLCGINVGMRVRDWAGSYKRRG